MEAEEAFTEAAVEVFTLVEADSTAGQRTSPATRAIMGAVTPIAAIMGAAPTVDTTPMVEVTTGTGGTAATIGATRTMVGDGAGDLAGAGRIRVGDMAIRMVIGDIRPITIPIRIMRRQVIRKPIRIIIRTSARRDIRAYQTGKGIRHRAICRRMAQRGRLLGRT
jgi:hypothetical protein